MTTSVHAEPQEWEPALIRSARKGDVRAFERLYRLHVGRVHALCLRLTREVALAEDCVQEVFVNAWRALDRFETRSAFGTWLHRIAVNVVLSKRRRAAAWAERIAETDRPEEVADGEWTFDTPVEVAELEEAIGTLPEGARDAVVLCGIYGYSHSEAAQMLGLAEGTCKAQLHRARQLLRERLKLE